MSACDRCAAARHQRADSGAHQGNRRHRRVCHHVLIAKYDPDGDPNDFRPDDLEWVDSWLDSPVQQALAKDLGRAFRAEPPEKQLAEPEPSLVEAEARQVELIAALENVTDHDDIRHQLLQRHGEHVSGLRARIAELRSQL
jgi:hypothetical protein